jgi:hypothetical protein
MADPRALDVHALVDDPESGVYVRASITMGDCDHTLVVGTHAVHLVSISGSHTLTISGQGTVVLPLEIHPRLRVLGGTLVATGNLVLSGGLECHDTLLTAPTLTVEGGLLAKRSSFDCQNVSVFHGPTMLSRTRFERALTIRARDDTVALDGCTVGGDCNVAQYSSSFSVSFKHCRFLGHTGVVGDHLTRSVFDESYFRGGLSIVSSSGVSMVVIRFCVFHAGAHLRSDGPVDRLTVANTEARAGLVVASTHDSILCSRFTHNRINTFRIEAALQIDSSHVTGNTFDDCALVADSAAASFVTHNTGRMTLAIATVCDNCLFDSNL